MLDSSFNRRVQRWRDLPRCGLGWANEARDADHRRHHCKRPRGHANNLDVCACGATRRRKKIRHR